MIFFDRKLIFAQMGKISHPMQGGGLQLCCRKRKVKMFLYKMRQTIPEAMQQKVHRPK